MLNIRVALEELLSRTSRIEPVSVVVARDVYPSNGLDNLPIGLTPVR